MNETWFHPTAQLAPTETRHNMFREITRRGQSVVGYSVATELAFGRGLVETVTVIRTGDVDRTATVVTGFGTTTLQSVDGEWRDSQGNRLTPADAKVIDDQASGLVGLEF